MTVSKKNEKKDIKTYLSCLQKKETKTTRRSLLRQTLSLLRTIDKYLLEAAKTK